MTRIELFQHLEENGCYKVDGGEFPEGSFVRNCINSHICYVDMDNINSYSSGICCHIFYQLGIASPFFLEDDLEVYKNFRDKNSFIPKNGEEI